MVGLSFTKLNLEKSSLVSPSVSGFSNGNSLLIGIWDAKSLVEVFEIDHQQLYKLKSKLGISQEVDFNLVHNCEDFEHVDYDSFEPLHLKNYFPTSVNEDKLLDYEKLKQQKVYTLSALPKKINEDLAASRLKIRKHHVSTAMANTVLDDKDQILILISDRQLQLVVHKDKKFQLYLQEETTTAKDFLYFILLSAKRLNLGIADISVSIGGTIDQSSPLYTLLKAYIPQLEFFSSSKFKLDGSSHPFHYYLPLFIAKACE